MIAVQQNTIIVRLIYGTSLNLIHAASRWSGCFYDMFILSNSTVGLLFDHAANSDALLFGEAFYTGWMETKLIRATWLSSLSVSNRAWPHGWLHLWPSLRAWGKMLFSLWAAWTRCHWAYFATRRRWMHTDAADEELPEVQWHINIKSLDGKTEKNMS